MNDPEKYTISKNGYQCISGCYAKESHIVDPHTNGFLEISRVKKNVCLIPRYKGYKNVGRHYDQCENDVVYYSDIAANNPTEYELRPNYFFNSTSILKYNYDIITYNNLLDMLSSDEIITTKLRFLNYGWLAFNENFLINDIFIKILVNAIKSLWIYDLVNILFDLDYEINKNPNRRFSNRNIIEKYILDNLVDDSSVSKLLEKFLKKDNIKYFTNEFKNFYYDVVLSNMKKKLSREYNL